MRATLSHGRVLARPSGLTGAEGVGRGTGIVSARSPVPRPQGRHRLSPPPRARGASGQHLGGGSFLRSLPVGTAQPTRAPRPSAAAGHPRRSWTSKGALGQCSAPSWRLRPSWRLPAGTAARGAGTEVTWKGILPFRPPSTICTSRRGSRLAARGAWGLSPSRRSCPRARTSLPAGFHPRQPRPRQVCPRPGRSRLSLLPPPPG